MPMIFDRFATREQALAFAKEVGGEHDLEVRVFDNALEALEVDPFPYELNPPIVHVERADPVLELELEALVVAFGGTFAGT
jgi:hypothetical protein